MKARLLCLRAIHKSETRQPRKDRGECELPLHGAPLESGLTTAPAPENTAALSARPWFREPARKGSFRKSTFIFVKTRMVEGKETPGPAATPPRDNKGELDWWLLVFLQAPVHHMGHFLERKDFAALQRTSAGLQECLRNVLRARNEELPEGKRMVNLEGEFCLWRVFKELLKREGRHFVDIIATGGLNDDGYTVLNTVKCLDLVTKQYTVLGPMVDDRWLHATAVLDGKLFIMGGYNMYSLSSVECLDLETGLWSEAAPMSAARDDHGAAVIEGKIFVVGGSDGYQDLSSVECFDPATAKWTALTPMNRSRCGHGVVSAQGKLFAVGGNGPISYPRYEALRSVECLDPSTGVWTNVNPMSEARQLQVMAVLGDKLFAIGGEDADHNKLSSVECLDLSVQNSTWTPVASMNMPRSEFGVAVTRGMLYAIGDSGDARSSMECFDPSDGPTGKWTIISGVSFPSYSRCSAF